MQRQISGYRIKDIVLDTTTSLLAISARMAQRPFKYRLDGERTNKFASDKQPLSMEVSLLTEGLLNKALSDRDDVPTYLVTAAEL